MAKQKISVLGCGWYGFALAKELVKHGYQVNGSTTSEVKLPVLNEEGIAAYLVDFNKEIPEFDPVFFDCDILVISFPPKKNTQLLVTYPDQIKNIVTVAAEKGVKEVILISSTGVYQDGNFVVDESIIPNPIADAGKNLLAAENNVKQVFPNATIIRFGGLFGPDRNLAKYFSGRIDIPNGLAPVNLIHLTDCLGITLALMEQNAFGNLYHGVSPNHPTKMDFYTKACDESGLVAPQFKRELLQWKQIESVNVPTILGYRFLNNLGG